MSDPSQAAVVLTNGRILTMDPSRPRASAIAVAGGRVIAVGGDQEVIEQAAKRSRRIDLDGQAVVPGFIESHVHPTFLGLSDTWVDCRSPLNRTIEDMVERLRSRAQLSRAGEWVRGFGYDDTALKDDRHPDRSDLDRASSEVPILITHISGHFAVANSAALAAAEVTSHTPNPNDGRFVQDGAGRPTGLLWELGAVRYVNAHIPPLVADDVFQANSRALAIAASRGATTVHDLGVGITGGQVAVTVYEEMAKEERLPIRVRGFLAGELLPSLSPELFPINRAETVGTLADYRLVGVKYWADGSIQGLSAALHEPYCCDPRASGELNYTPGELRGKVTRAHELGFQVAIHANGDRAVDAAIDAIEYAMVSSPRPDPRHRLEHVQVVHPHQLAKMRRLGINASFFINHVYYWGDRHRDRFLGRQRARDIDPLRSARQEGLPFGLHSDCPITPMDPLFTWWAAVNRRTSGGDLLGPHQRLEVEEALCALTTDAAYLVYDESYLGRLREGYAADLVILSEDPLTVDPNAIKDIQIQQVMVRGGFVAASVGLPTHQGGR